MSSIQMLEEEILQLSRDQRLALANRILSSIEPAESVHIEEAWQWEIQARIKKYNHDPTRALPAKTVFQKLDESLNKCR